MKSKIVSIILILILVLVAIPVAAQVDIDLYSAILIDYNTGEEILAVNEDEKLPPASITKIMTLLLTMEALEDNKIALSDKLQISKKAASTVGTSIYLDEGESQTVENLIKAVSIRSANDAAVALAEYISGSENEFVNLMNKKAKALGMEKTLFSNSTGLPSENHYSTAKDIAIMSRELLKYEEVYKYLTSYMEDLEVGKSKKSIQTLVNTNRLVKEYNGTTGIKTGYTKEAQHCLAASARRGDLHLIAIVLKSDNSRERFDHAMKLLDYGFSNYDSKLIGKKGDSLTKVSVEKAKFDSLDLILERDALILLKKDDKGKIETEIKKPSSIKAPVKSNQAIGELIIKVDGKKLDSIKLLAKGDVLKANLLDTFNKLTKEYLFGQ